MAFTSTDFPGLLVYEPRVFKDERGFFFESYNQQVFEEQNFTGCFIQDNQSFSHFGVIRGLHYQLPPYAQTKLLRVLHGRILDVVVDIRNGSPTFGKSFSIELTADNKKQLLIPKGFAHGFAALSSSVEILYKCDSFYHKISEGGFVFNDPLLRIDWHIPASQAIVSAKDMELPVFAPDHHYFDF